MVAGIRARSIHQERGHGMVMGAGHRNSSYRHSPSLLRRTLARGRAPAQEPRDEISRRFPAGMARAADSAGFTHSPHGQSTVLGTHDSTRNTDVDSRAIDRKSTRLNS